MLRGWRISAALLLIANVGLAPAFPPEHVHEHDQAHGTATLHRHLSSHDAHGPRDRARIDDDDEQVIWIAAAWLQTPIYWGPIVASESAIQPLTPPESPGWTAVVLDAAAPPHGPPRSAVGLRAPPFLPV